MRLKIKVKKEMQNFGINVAVNYILVCPTKHMRQ